MKKGSCGIVRADGIIKFISIIKVYLMKPIVYQRWARVPGFAFPRSRVPGISGTRERGIANVLQERSNQ